MNIFALSSGKGPSGIAIVRISGPQTLDICKALTNEKNIKSNEINLCKFIDPKNNKIIDPEALLLWFPKPHSFTGEDLAELHIHGSNAVISYLLKVLSDQKNCRLAEPGEFTKIAFQNNKIDLIKAESIGDLIHAETELQREQAANLVQGHASKYYENLREKLDKKLLQLQDPGFRLVTLSQAIGSSFEESFKGVIKGTMSVSQAFANMANRISDALLDMAASTIATGLQRMFIGAFSRNLTPLNDVQGTTQLAANGGPVGMRQPYLVGERGPELFVPNQSGNIIPNHDLAGVGGGSTSVVVNVDASGTSVEGDQTNGEELGRLIGAAVQAELIKERRPGGLLG